MNNIEKLKLQISNCTDNRELVDLIGKLSLELDAKKIGEWAKPVSYVLETKNYDLFKLIQENREPDHVKALIASFKNHLVPNAILCNEKYEIIDGQNRFLALKELGEPILFYMIKGLDIYDVAHLNSYGKNWSNIDYIKMWAALGKEEYKKILRFCDEFPDFSLQNAVVILADASQRTIAGHMLGDDTLAKVKDKQVKISAIRDGSFVIKDIEHSRFIARCIMEYKTFSKPGTQIYKQQAFVTALVRILRNKNFDNAEMVRKISLYPSMFYRCVNAKQYIGMLEELWNYKRRTKSRFNY